MKLSAALQLKIDQHPTFTTIRSASLSKQIHKIISGRHKQVPNSFDGSVVWKDYLSSVRNQGRCGSCWAFASSSVLADRFNIQSKGVMNVELSPTKMIVCSFLKDININTDEETKLALNRQNIKTHACRGNSLTNAWKYLNIIGTNTEECVPYNKSLGNKLDFRSLSQFQKDEQLPFCNITGPMGDMCVDVSFDKYSFFEYGTPARFYRCLNYYAVGGTDIDDSDESNIRNDIYTWGPVSTGMIIYPNFYTFDSKKEIYEWDGKDEPVGGHAVEIVGWGEQNSKKYWIIKNSWGTDWGRNGYFYMIRGKNDCEIEENVIAGIPNFFYDKNYVLNTGGRLAFDGVKENNTAFVGGIEATNGYTNRVIATKPWLDFSSPINTNQLPNWETFVAGIDVVSKEKIRLWQSLTIIILIAAILIVLIVAIKIY